ncbi:MAG: hypothetical protein ACMG6H_13305 [Acidobacteriota bacterium]
MATGSSQWNSNRITELREFPTDLAPNDANWTRAAGARTDVGTAKGAGRGVSRGPKVWLQEKLRSH